MWLFEILPNFVVHAILLIGLGGLGASFVLNFIPFVTQYRILLQVIASILIVLGVFLEGGLVNNQSWQNRVAELQVKLAKAEVASAEANVKLEDAISKNNKLITAAQNKTRQDIIKNNAEINKDCNLNNTSIQLYNQAITGAKK